MSAPKSQSPWLAISFGCCASRRDSIEEDDGRAALRANGTSEMQVCYDQPRSVSQPRAEPIYARPSTSHSMGQHVSQWVASSRDFATRASSRASIHTLSKPRKSQSKLRIGMPMDVRHFDGLDGVHGIQSMLDDAPMPVRRRRSFRPLELSIYLPDGRLSPLPDFAQELPEMPAHALVRNRDSRGSSISSAPSSSSYQIQRKPVGSGSRRSSLQSQASRPVSEIMPLVQEEPKSRPESVLSNPFSLQRSSTRGSISSPRRIISRLPSPNRSRSNTDSSQRGSLRRAKTDVDEAIRELNTIVEERRADAYRSTNQSPALINRPPPSPSHHVPAIAPSLRMHVRSETLSDIGSAFSVPLATKPLPTIPSSNALSRQTTKLSIPQTTRDPAFRPLSSNPITPPTPTAPTPTTPIARLGAWIKRSLPSSPTDPTLRRAPSSKSLASATSSTPFYQCTPPLPQTSYPVSNSPRPSTAGSRTLHIRQESNDTATVTLFSMSSAPSTPSLSSSSRCGTPDLAVPATPERFNLLKGEGKARRVPKPLVLVHEKEIAVEKPLASARSARSLVPPKSPNYGILKGMEMPARQSVLPSPGAVGVAF
ncbi:hypothetical protein P154DRAFT_616746 [Amniculicola lignicola CBS 123094]|uniref:Uncharacterized protein n=1 Tax=Amniculicola lignicola CBS 123094 TaxID=1392246 RepID=A0A6A5X1X4_9PLEO|nr:hypothetical protein P154DRAFT_616746 [Amniculicola lignicola CBS 123094]